MFSLKKKKTRGIQGGGIQGGVRINDIHGDEPIEWLEQHHKKTMGQVHSGYTNNHNPYADNQATNIFSHQQHLHPSNQQHGPISSGFEYPLSGDESDNHHNRMEHLRSQFYTPDPQKRTKEYHMEQSMQAIEQLKVVSRPNGWKKVDRHKSGCTVYQSTTATTIPNHGGENKYPAFKGEHIIRGHKAQDVFAIIGVRKLWDDWYDELSCIESYDDTTNLMYMVMKGSLSSRTRDVSMVERTEIESDGTIYFAACSVDSPKIPRIAGKVRAEIFLAGWIIQPLPSNPPITKVTYVIQTDLLNRLPKFIAKRSLTKRALVATIIETYLKKNGSPSTNVPTTAARPRSSIEPVMLDRFIIPPDSDDEDMEEPDMTFITPLAPITPNHNDNHADDEDEDSDDEAPRKKQQPYYQAAPSPKTPGANGRASLLSSNSLFTRDFIDNSTFLGDSTALFSDSLLFNNESTIGSTIKKQESNNATNPSELGISRPIIPKSTPSTPVSKPIIQEKSRTMAPTTKTLSPEPETWKSQSSKRASIPVVQPKSEARTKQYNNSTQNLSPDQKELIPMIAPTTPPLTPTASINSKDVTSDSDAAQTPEVKVVPRVSKNSTTTPEAIDTDGSRRNSTAISSFGMKSPSAMMEARRHSALMGRGTPFVPRHSHAVPIRGNPNISLQSLIRPTGTTSTAMKRLSAAPSLESNRSLTSFPPTMILPHRHSETARKALAMFKVLASSPEDRWRTISSENGFKSYSRVISGAGLPMLRSEGVITGGWTVEQINAVIESSGCRSSWDERFENMSIAETFNHNEYLFHVTLKGVGSMTGRDLAGVTIIDRDPMTSALYNVSTSVLDPTIPEDPGRIRAMLELSGWSLRPIFDGQGNTVSVNVTFVVQIDIRGNLPSSIVKSMTASMTTAVPKLNQFINKIGYPPFASHISGTRLLDTFDPATGFYELCYKAAPGWTEVRVGHKVYKEGYDFFIKPDDHSVRVEVAPDFGGVRIWTTLDHEGQSIIIQVSRKGMSITELTSANEEAKQDAEVQTVEGLTIKSEPINDFNSELDQNDVEKDSKHSATSSRKRRSASYSAESGSNTRPDSQASIASKASQSSERSRSRGRTPRQIVTLPAGTPPPPLPRRSSSLSRYSIPINAYLPGPDAPPVPTNAATLEAGARSSTASGLEVVSSPITSTRPTPDSPIILAPAAQIESKPVIPASSRESVCDPLTMLITAAAAAAAAAAANAQKTEATTEEVTDRSQCTPAMATTSKPIEIASLASQPSPAASPVPSAAPSFGPRSSSLTNTSMVASGASSPVATPAPSGFQPSSRLKHSTSIASIAGTSSGPKRRDVRVTFSLDTVDKSVDADAAQLTATSSPLDSLANTSSNSKEGITVHNVVSQSGAIESQDSEYESDEAEFVEARDTLSEDEMEFALVLTSIGAWPSDSSSSTSCKQSAQKEMQEEMVMASMQALERGFQQIVLGSSVQAKAAIVFLLLVYYAGRLSSLIA